MGKKRNRMKAKATRSELADKTRAALLLIWERYEAFLADPNDPETNHKFRVSIRTARSLVNFLEPWQKRRQNKRLQNDLKAVVRETSRLRELDVLCELVSESDELSDELLAICRNEATQERESVLAVLQTEPMVERLQRSVATAENLAWKKRFTKKGISPAKVQDRFDALLARLQHDLETLDENDYEQVHATRKRAKQVRYVSEQYACVLSDDARETALSMKAEQDRLGALCDAKVNRELLEGFLASLS